MEKWTEEEIKILKREYKKRTDAKTISEILGKSIKAVRNKAYKLKITDTSDNWTKDQIDFLKDNFEKYSLDELSQRLCNRNKSNICRKAKELGVEVKGKHKKKRTETKWYRDEKNVWHQHGWKRKTKEEIAEKRSIIMKEWHKTHEHPKGMLGKQQSEATRKRFSERMVEDWKNPKSTYNTDEFRQLKSDIMFRQRLEHRNSITNYSRAKSGKRADLNDMYFRSAWEANYARYLNFLTKKGLVYKWEYEPDVFIFEQIKRGTRSYIPDFKIWDKKDSKPYYVEVKGWMDDKSKTKLKRMEKYYPDVKIILFQKEDYKELKNKLGRVIENWEE